MKSSRIRRRTSGTVAVLPSGSRQRAERQQGGDPAKLASAILQLAGVEEPPARFAAGADALQTFEGKAKTLSAQANAYRDLSSSLAHE
jgi:hypothetical protein